MMIDTCRYMTVKETAKYLNIGLNACYSLCKDADFPVFKIGNKKLIDKVALDEIWIPNRINTYMN